MILNVDGISIYTKTYITTYSDQIGQIYLSQEELKLRRIGLDAMIEHDAVHTGLVADVTAHLLDTDGKRRNRTSRHRSSGQCNADKNMAKNGFLNGGPNSIESKIGSH